MKFSIIFVLLSVFTKAYASDEQFLLGPGDVIKIDVYNEPDLALQAKVANSGELRVPLLGNVRVAGKTVQQLNDELESAYLDGYLVNPSVSVVVKAFRPFYVRGAVVSPGAYAFDFDMTVEQAIAVAKGLKDRASKRDWFIIRDSEKTRDKALKGTKVRPGDIIEIEESIF